MPTNGFLASLHPSQPPKHRMSCSPSTSIVYLHPSLHNPPHAVIAIAPSGFLASSVAAAAGVHRPRMPCTRTAHQHRCQGLPLPRTSKVYPWPPIPPCKPRHVPRVWLSVTYTPVQSRRVSYTLQQQRGVCSRRGGGLRQSRSRCTSGLLMMRGRGWNHTTMMRNVFYITRASLSLVHDACASVVLSSSSVESSPLSHHNVGVT
jgi:hypothetical protein